MHARGKKENLCNHKSSREETGFCSDRIWTSDLNGGMMIEWEAAETTLSYPHLPLLFDSLVIFRSRIVTLGCYLRVCQTHTHTLLVLFWNNFLFAPFLIRVAPALSLCVMSSLSALHFFFLSFFLGASHNAVKAVQLGKSAAAVANHGHVSSKMHVLCCMERITIFWTSW